ncbi:hypothetical protein [Aurantivibrio plasticivorans]
MRTTTIRLLILTLLGGILTACGGGGGSSSAPTSQAGANQPPVVRITFPNAHSLTNQSTITIRGTASDPDGDGIAFVSVNGIVAVTKDGFANWAATVPLAFGENTLTVSAVDSEQNALMDEPTIRVLQQSTFLARPDAGVVDVENNELFIADSDIPGIVAIDLETNERRLVSINEEGDDVSFSRPNDIGLAPAGACASLLPSTARCLVVLDNNISTLFVVDADTGERAVLSGGEDGDEIGDGPAFSLQALHLAVGGPEFCPSSLANRFANCALVMENFGSVKVVDLATGERVAVLQNGAVGGPNFSLITTIIADDNSTCNSVLPGTNKCLITIDRRLNAVIAADLDSGERAVLSGDSRGSGPSLGGPRAMVLVGASHCASVLPNATRCALTGNQSQGSVVAVDLISGDRAILSSPERGAGPEFSTPNELVFDPVNQRALAIDEVFDSPIAIDAVTGDRSLMLDHRVGNGPELRLARGLVQLSTAQCDDMLGNSPCGIIIDTDKKRLFSVDFSSGDRTLLVDLQDSAGQALDFIAGVIVDEGNSCESLLVGVRHCALVVDPNDNVFAVNLDNGERAILSPGPEDVGFTVDAPGFVVDNCNPLVTDVARCLVKVGSGDRSVVAIDLATGSRSLISSDTRGIGPLFATPRSIVPDSNNHCANVLPGASQCAFVLTSSFDFFSEPRVIAVDLQTGDRAIVSDSMRGEGPRIILPLSISGASERLCQTHTPFAACLLLTDAFTGSLIAVDLATGDREIIFEEVLLRPRTVVVDSSSSDFVFMLDARLHGIVTVDPNTSEGTLSSWSGIIDFR